MQNSALTRLCPCKQELTETDRKQTDGKQTSQNEKLSISCFQYDNKKYDAIATIISKIPLDIWGTSHSIKHQKITQKA